jgi:hypothetical protein
MRGNEGVWNTHLVHVYGSSNRGDNRASRETFDKECLATHKLFPVRIPVGSRLTIHFNCQKTMSR